MECPERLYLARGNGVYIDNCQLPQHYIDGIRFLYKQFIKSKPGVIVNDPTGYDKEVQIVLFLKAVSPLLTQPILVLCPEGDETEWLEMFQTWTDLDVAIESSKPYLKKKVLITNMGKLSLFSQPQWGALVVSDQGPGSGVLRHQFKTTFRIWSTYVDMKEDLHTFSSIYTWINQEKLKCKNPVDNFDIKEFTPIRGDAKDIIDKAIMLDAFMEDIVLRRKKMNGYSEEIKQELPKPDKASKKNKDATGTKVKRSKRKIEITNTEKCTDDDVTPKLSKTSGKTNNFNETKVILNDNNYKGTVKEFNTRKRNNTFAIGHEDKEMYLHYEEDSSNDSMYNKHTLPSRENDSQAELMECDKTESIDEILKSNNGKWKSKRIIIESDSESMESNDISLYTRQSNVAAKMNNNILSTEDKINNIHVNKDDEPIEFDSIETETRNDANQSNEMIIENDSKSDELLLVVDVDLVKFDDIPSNKSNDDVEGNREMDNDSPVLDTEVIQFDSIVSDKLNDKFPNNDIRNEEHIKLSTDIPVLDTEELKYDSIPSEKINDEVQNNEMTDNELEISNDSSVNEIAVSIMECDQVNEIKNDEEEEKRTNEVSNKDVLMHDIKSSEVTDDVLNTSDAKSNMDDIDVKTNEFKEQIIKKFKGSILDSIF